MFTIIKAVVPQENFPLSLYSYIHWNTKKLFKQLPHHFFHHYLNLLAPATFLLFFRSHWKAKTENCKSLVRTYVVIAAVNVEERRENQPHSGCKAPSRKKWDSWETPLTDWSIEASCKIKSLIWKNGSCDEMTKRTDRWACYTMWGNRSLPKLYLVMS